jgi:hypothetical protein
MVTMTFLWLNTLTSEPRACRCIAELTHGFELGAALMRSPHDRRHRETLAKNARLHRS